MSKSILKRELGNLTKEQLVEVILGVYKVSKEAKEYFEYFIDPQPEKLFDANLNLIHKEFNRTKYGRISKARISKIRAILRNFILLEPGFELVERLYIATFELAANARKLLSFPPALIHGVCRLAVDLLKLANQNDCFTQVYNEFQGLIGSPHFPLTLRKELDQTVKAFLTDPKVNASLLK